MKSRKETSFPDRFNGLIADSRIKVKTIIQEMNVSRTTVCRWRKGQGMPRRKTLSQMAEMFGTTTSYLLGETDEPYITPAGAVLGTTRGKPSGKPFDMQPFSDVLTEAAMQIMTSSQIDLARRTLQMAIEELDRKALERS